MALSLDEDFPVRIRSGIQRNLHPFRGNHKRPVIVLIPECAGRKDAFFGIGGRYSSRLREFQIARQRRRASVDIQCPVYDLDRISGKSDTPLQIECELIGLYLVPVAGKNKDDDVIAFNVSESGDPKPRKPHVRERYVARRRTPKNELVHEKQIASQHLVFHRTRGDEKRSDDKIVEEQKGAEDDSQFLEEGKDFLLHRRNIGMLLFRHEYIFQYGLVFHGKDCKKRLLRYLHAPHLLHSLLPLFLLFQQFPFAGNVAAIALRQNVLPHRAQCLACDDLAPDGGLDSDLKHLTWDKLPKFRAQFSSPIVSLDLVNNGRQCVHRLSVQQDIEFDEVRFPVFEKIIVQGRIAPRERFQPVIEIENDLGKRKLKLNVCPLRAQIGRVPVNSASIHAQFHDPADILRRGNDLRLHIRLLHELDIAGRRHDGGIVDHDVLPL